MAPRLSFVSSDASLFDANDFDKLPVSSYRNTVSFALQEDVKEFDDDTTSGWYTTHEMQSFKAEASKSVSSIMNGTYRTVSDFCERGLENMTKAAAIQLKSRRRFAVKSVLDIQRAQQEQGVVDSDAVAHAYERATSRSQASAVARGQSDAKALRL